MELKQNQNGSFDLTTSIAVFLVCLIISLAVAAFHYWYFPAKYIDYKSDEVQKLLNTESDFTEIAKKVLNTRNDIAYLRLLDQNGVLEESFGGKGSADVKKINLNAPDNKTIVVGIKSLSTNRIDGYALLWSLIIGSSISIILLFIMFLLSPAPDRTVEKLAEAMRNAASGNYSSRLNIDSSVKGDDQMVSIFSSFNSIMDRISSTTDDFSSGEELSDAEEPEISIPEDEQLYDEREGMIVEEDEDDLHTGGEFTAYKEPAVEKIEEKSETDEPGKEEKTVDLTTHEEDHDEDIEGQLYEADSPGGEVDEDETVSKFQPKVVSMDDSTAHAKHRNVTVLVAKIAEFDSLVSDLEPSDLNSFISEYRKNVSSIVADYGGVIEALLQDEIVAIFNAPEKQDSPELRSVSASVEIMQLIADLAKRRKAQGKRIITGKIGVSLSSIPFFSDSGIPDRVKDIVESAKNVCNNTNKWKIYLTGDVYDCVKDHVEVRQTKVNGNFYFSVVGVEEGVLRN